MDIKFDTIKQLDASESVVANMREYQRYLAASKLPHPVDGLKDVTRRAIYLMGTTRDKIKGAQFIASIMKMHPHGDGSIRGAVERLFRPWDVGIPLISCDGNKGAYSDVPAAPRYLNLSSSEYARDLFFNGVHSSTIPMEYTIEYDMFEPKYFIPRLPTALLIGNLTIGAGFKSVTFPLHLSNVCELIHRFIDNIGKHEIFTSKGLGHLFIPDFPTNCELRNYEQLVESYNNDSFSHKVYTDGVLQIDKHEIRISNIPALIPYMGMAEKLIDQLQSKTFWLNPLLRDIQNSEGVANSGGIALIFKNNVDVWNVLRQVKDLIRFTSSVTPLPNYEVEGTVVTYSPVDILKNWYKERYCSITNGLNATQNQLLREKLVVDALMCIVDNKDDVVNIVRNAESRNDAISALSSKFDISYNQAYNICKASIDKLVKTSRDELIGDREKIDKELTRIQSEYGSVNNIIYEDATYFNNKYRISRTTRIPKYIGYVKIGKRGLFQYESENELFDILKEHPASGIYQYKSPKTQKVRISDSDTSIIPGLSIPKQERGTSILEKIIADKDAYTIAYVGDTAMCIDGYTVPKDDTTAVQYVTSKFVGFHDTGVIEQSNVTDISQRKTISSGAKSSLIYAHSDKHMCKNQIVVYMSTGSGYANELIFTKIYDDERGYNKMMITPPNDLIILGVIDNDATGVILNIPRKCVNILIEYVYITDVSKILDTFITMSINLRSGGYVATDGSKIKPSRHIKCNSMVVI